MKKIEVECKKEQSDKNREKMVAYDKDGNFKLAIDYFSPTFDCFIEENDSLDLKEVIEQAFNQQLQDEDEDEVWGKNDTMILYSASGNILQEVDGQEIIDCICSKYGEALYEFDIIRYAIAEFLMAYYNVDVVKIDTLKYNRQEIENSPYSKIRFQFNKTSNHNRKKQTKQDITSNPISIVCSGGGKTEVEQFSNYEEVAEKIINDHIKQGSTNREEIKQNIVLTLSEGHAFNTDNDFVFMRQDAFFELFNDNDTQHNQECNCPECSNIKKEAPKGTTIFSVTKED
jgi:hypothetical protein